MDFNKDPLLKCTEGALFQNFNENISPQEMF